MISLSRIIKSAAVVDDRSQQAVLAQSMPDHLAMPVIKRQVLSGGALPSRGAARTAPTRDALQEELNRTRLQIEQAKKELRAVTGELESNRTEVKNLQERRQALEAMEDLTLDEQAKKILRDAEAQADQMLSWAKSQTADAVEGLKAQGYLDGLEQGANEAHAQYREEHRPEIERLSRLIQEMSGLRDEMIRENESVLIDLVVAIAEKVIGTQLRGDPGLVVELLRETVEQNRREEFIKVVISEDLLPAKAKASAEVKRMLQGLAEQLDIFVDTEAPPMSVLVETSKGITDLGVPTQLQNLHGVLKEG